MNDYTEEKILVKNNKRGANYVSKIMPTLDCFNQPINNLPDTITHLTLTWDFNQSIDYLPDTITHLTLYDSFNQLIDHLFFTNCLI